MLTLPDGSYRVFSDYGGYTSYQKHTLSLAVRLQGDDFAVYVADYQTGEPLPAATVRLINPKSDKKVLECDLPLNGFTVLPVAFQKKLGHKRYKLVAMYGERRSSFVFSPVRKYGLTISRSTSIVRPIFADSKARFRDISVFPLP